MHIVNVAVAGVCIQKRGIDFQRSVEIESSNIEDVFNWGLSKIHSFDAGTQIHPGQTLTQGVECLSLNKIAF